LSDDPLRCKTCHRLLNELHDPTTQDCGGDCLRCMATAGDLDCQRHLAEIEEQWRVHERQLLSLMSDEFTFGIALTAPLTPDQQFALERLQKREWIRLIDVSIIAFGRPGEVYRKFLVTAPALKWLKRTAH
jgi:hypothetical protein